MGVYKLRWILKRMRGRLCTGFIWRTLRTGREHLKDLGINGSVQIALDFEENAREAVYRIHLAHVTGVW